MRPWANNPAFYVTFFPSQSDQPAREGPLAYGAVELWSYRFPLSSEDAAAIERGVRVIPALLRQAQSNLVGNGRDLWAFGAREHPRAERATSSSSPQRLAAGPGGSRRA